MTTTHDYDGDPLPDPGKGYRLLVHNEVIPPGGEVHTILGTWELSEYEGRRVGSCVVLECVYRCKV